MDVDVQKLQKNGDLKAEDLPEHSRLSVHGFGVLQVFHYSPIAK